MLSTCDSIDTVGSEVKNARSLDEIFGLKSVFVSCFFFQIVDKIL